MFGAQDLSQPEGFAVKASASAMHPFYNRIFTINDFGVITLSSPVTARAWIPIDTREDPDLIGQFVTHVGYGVTDPEAPNSSGARHVIRKKVVDCSSVMRAPFPAYRNDQNICFDTSVRGGTCYGDSGGPAFGFIDGVRAVVGVTSFGSENCDVYSASGKVANAREWILSQMKS